jgi:excisionase family DNA binding protein
MAEVQMLFPMEPKEFWQKLKGIVEQVVLEHNLSAPVINGQVHSNIKPLLKVSEVCLIFKISKPTLYQWMKKGKLSSVKIQSRRFFRSDDVDHLIEAGAKNKEIADQTEINTRVDR